MNKVLLIIKIGEEGTSVRSKFKGRRFKEVIFLFLAPFLSQLREEQVVVIVVVTDVAVVVDVVVADVAVFRS